MINQWKGRARHGYWPYKESLLEYFTQLQGCENPRGVEQSHGLHWNLSKFTSHLSSMLLENMACIIRLDICHKIYRDVDFEVKVLHGIHRFSLLFKKEVGILSHPTGWAKIPTFLTASHSIKAKWPKSRGKWESRRAILCMTKNNYPHDLDILRSLWDKVDFNLLLWFRETNFRAQRKNILVTSRKVWHCSRVCGAILYIGRPLFSAFSYK